MATSPPLSPSIAAVKTARVEAWIQQLSEAASVSPPSPKGTSTTSTGAPSPKRRRHDSDTVLPNQSVSAVGSSQANTRSSRRANSPSRDNAIVLADLAFASPPIMVGPSGGTTKLPQRVLDVIARLGYRLHSGWIPKELREKIEPDGDKEGVFGYEMIEPNAWDDGGEEDETLTYMLREVKEIWLDAEECYLEGRDENAWCIDVILPLVRFAIELEGKEKFLLQSVQSQSIAECLSSIPDVSGNPRLLNRKADFTLSFSPLPSSGFKDLYRRLRTAGNHVVSHMDDAFTETTALFSCIEVKAADGDRIEAQYQLSVWMAASLRKKMQLAQHVGLVDKSGLVEPCFAVVGNETRVYVAYVAPEERDVERIIGPVVNPFALCQTNTASGIFRTLRLWRNVIKYERDEGSEGF